MIKAALFDVYGTCVDWRSGVANAVRPMLEKRQLDPELAEDVADNWRSLYEPFMERVRSGERAYEPLNIIQRENLDVVLDQLGIASSFDDLARAQLNIAWDQLPAWPDTVAALRTLKKTIPIAACSNGSNAMMTRLATHAQLDWSMICGAELAQNYKPVHAVYHASCAALGFETAQCVLIACHPSDLDAAHAAGLKTGFFPRPLEYGAANFLPEKRPERFDFHHDNMLSLIGMIATAAR